MNNLNILAYYSMLAYSIKGKKKGEALDTYEYLNEYLKIVANAYTTRKNKKKGK